MLCLYMMCDDLDICLISRLLTVFLTVLAINEWAILIVSAGVNISVLVEASGVRLHWFIAKVHGRTATFNGILVTIKQKQADYLTTVSLT